MLCMGAADGNDHLERIAQGREAEVFLLTDGRVAKVQRDPRDRARVEREATALRILLDHNLAAPEPHGFMTVDGRPGLVMNRLPGANLLDQLGRNPLRLDRMAESMGRVHASLHRITAPTQLPALRDELRGRIECAAPLSADQRRRALAVLDTLPNGDRLCHGDFHLGNMLGEPSEPHVIDWADATRGDPMGDMVRTALLLRVGNPPPGTSRLLRILAPIGGSLLSARYVTHYRRHYPVDDETFVRWRLVRAAARLDEPVFDEHPDLLAIVNRDLAALS